MNKFFASIAVAASAFALASCSNDELVAEGGANAPVDGQMYTRLTLSLPQASKSETITPEDPDDNVNSDSGYEVGNEGENNVSGVLVVIAKRDNDSKTSGYTYLTSNLADGHPSASSSKENPIYNVQFQTRALYDNAGKEVYVFAFCNPTPALVNAAQAASKAVDDALLAGTPAPNWDFINLTGAIAGDEGSSISKPNAFFMSNWSLTKTTLPSTDDMDKTYNTAERPFPLGIVNVERATARFDFKQTTVEGQDEPNRYPIYNQALTEDGKKGPVQAYVVLDGMALQNEAINYYYLPRVNDNGMNTAMEICYPEIIGNYVVSPNADEKIKPSFEAKFIQDNYLYNARTIGEDGKLSGTNFASLDYDPLNTSLGEDDDNHWTAPDKIGYHIWRYVSENTIPGGDQTPLSPSFQRTGVTTAVIFRGHIKATTENADLNAAMNAKKVLYAYNGILYGDLAMIKKYILSYPASSLADAFRNAWGYPDSEDLTEEALADEKYSKDLDGTVANFTIYRPDTNGNYPVYYPYYNRHNDNHYNTVMGLMEFGVVRNNIYKLSVSNILEFGHPGDPDDDPDPEDPGDPDESPKTYFRVQVRVLPWVVRVNNIIL